jgi:hypothetical protein
MSRKSAAHAPRAHLYGFAAPVVALAPMGPLPSDDADYLNASPLARFIARLLMRFF